MTSPPKPQSDRPILIDPAVFESSAISDETHRLNDMIRKIVREAPSRWSIPAAEVRRLRKETGVPFPLAPHSPRAETIEIDGPAESIPLRLVRPKGTPRGVFLHIHGGGWMLGGADQQDPLLERIADAASVISLSVDYRLAPEDPYPAGPDDCEAAALWLAKNAQGMFGTERLLIGGDSAGAHLSLVTLLRLRDRHGLTPFSAVMFDAGCFDLRLTPSVRSWGDDPLILNTLDIRNFVSGFVQNQSLLEEPDVSPLLADLSGLPPALFNVGTLDPLVDDSLMMAARWTAAGNAADLAIWPGGAHVFTVFPGAQADAARARIDAFLTAAAMGVSA